MERKRQQHAAVDTVARNGGYVYRFHYLCSDNTTFSAIAPTEAGAFRVLNAERPGVIAERFIGYTTCPIETRAGQLQYEDKLSRYWIS